MTSTDEWRIRRNRERCERPGCPLPTATDWYAVLELPSCERQDLCETCFQVLPTEGDARPIHWRVKRQEDDKKSVTLDLASLRVLFDRLGDVIDGGDDESSAATGGAGASEDSTSGSADADSTEEEAEQGPTAAETAAGLRFFVGLILVRKRQLRIIDAKGPEQEAADLVVIDPKASDEAEPVLLFQPDLTEERLERLKDELIGALSASDSD
ncbi:MAG: hypothetical protein AAF196_13080 [Planctomycetota bacterium]